MEMEKLRWQIKYKELAISSYFMKSRMKSKLKKKRKEK
jgi:hypothetical protein